MKGFKVKINKKNPKNEYFMFELLPHSYLQEYLRRQGHNLILYHNFLHNQSNPHLFHLQEYLLQNHHKVHRCHHLHLESPNQTQQKLHHHHHYHINNHRRDLLEYYRHHHYQLFYHY